MAHDRQLQCYTLITNDMAHWPFEKLMCLKRPPKKGTSGSQLRHIYTRNPGRQGRKGFPYKAANNCKVSRVTIGLSIQVSKEVLNFKVRQVWAWQSMAGCRHGTAIGVQQRSVCSSKCQQITETSHKLGRCYRCYCCPSHCLIEFKLGHGGCRSR